MPSAIEALNERWDSIPLSTPIPTPSGESRFTVHAVQSDEISIRTDGNTPMKLRRAAFAAALEYLEAQSHDAGHPCRIGSDKSYANAGDLCKAVRDANSASGGTMVITYVLPILQELDLVRINSKIPNTVWLT